MPITFIHGEQGIVEAEGEILSEGQRKDVASTPSPSLQSADDSENKSQQIETEVEFADDPDVPFLFRGRKVRTKLAQVEVVFSVQNNEKVLATCKQWPIWSVFEIDEGKTFQIGFALDAYLC